MLKIEVPYMIFVGFDYVSISKKAFVNLFFPVKNMTDDFIGSFIMFYLFVPFINKLIGSLNSKQHLRLVLLCLLTFSILPQTTIATIRINYVMWFGVVYLVASYIRLYPLSIWHCEDKRFWGLISIAFMLLASISVIVALKCNTKDAYVDPFLLVSDSNAILAVAVSFSTFMFFKNVHIRSNRIINTVASSTFGVLCIHANSNTMRQWLWYDETKMLELFSKDSFYELKAVGYVVAVFMICTVIDQLRMHLFEKPLFQVLDKKLMSCKYWK